MSDFFCPVGKNLSGQRLKKRQFHLTTRCNHRSARTKDFTAGSPKVSLTLLSRNTFHDSVISLMGYFVARGNKKRKVFNFSHITIPFIVNERRHNLCEIVILKGYSCRGLENIDHSICISKGKLLGNVCLSDCLSAGNPTITYLLIFHLDTPTRGLLRVKSLKFSIVQL